MTAIDRLIVFAPNWLGDAVMALPAIADVRQAFREAQLGIAARAGLAALFEAVPGVDAVVRLNGQGWRAQRRDCDAIRAGSWNAALLLPNSFHAAWLAWRSGIGQRWGYRSDLRSMLLTRAVRKPSRARRHQAEYYQALTRALDIPSGPLTPRVHVDDRVRASAGHLLRAAGWRDEPLVGLGPGAAYGSAKQWLPQRMGVLASRLQREHHTRVVVVGSVEDVDAARAVVESAEQSGAPLGSVINVAGRTTLAQLMGVLVHCTAFVSNDSGAMHLAAALDVPVTAIFGATREWATSPLPGPAAHAPAIVHADVFCRPCMLRTCPIDHRCMTRIGVDEVLAPVLRSLSPHSAA